MLYIESFNFNEERLHEKFSHKNYIDRDKIHATFSRIYFDDNVILTCERHFWKIDEIYQRMSNNIGGYVDVQVHLNDVNFQLWLAGRRKNSTKPIEIAVEEDVTENSREVTCNLWLLTYGDDSGEKFHRLFAVFLSFALSSARYDTTLDRKNDFLVVPRNSDLLQVAFPANISHKSVQDCGEL